MREEYDKCGSNFHCHWTSIVNKDWDNNKKALCSSYNVSLFQNLQKWSLTYNSRATFNTLWCCVSLWTEPRGLYTSAQPHVKIGTSYIFLL